MIRIAVLIPLVLLLLPSDASAQNVEASKLNSGAVMEGTSVNAPKIVGGAVFSNDDSSRASKLVGGAVLTTTVVDETIVETLSWFDGVQAFAAGGGGGGGAGMFGIGELGENGRLDGVGGYGGSADLANTPRQTTSGATGNTGTEFDSITGAGSGGGGGDWSVGGTGQAGGAGGTFGGGGGGGGGGTVAGGAGALGGEGIIWMQYTPSGGGPAVTITLDKDSGPTWTVPTDWTNVNKIVLVGAGGCGGSGSTVAGGNGGYGGDAVGGLNLNLFTPSQVVDIEVNTAVEACAGTGNLHTKLGDIAAGDGKSALGNSGFYGGGESLPIPPGGAAISYLNTGGLGGRGGNFFGFESTSAYPGLHPWMPLTHW